MMKGPGDDLTPTFIIEPKNNAQPNPAMRCGKTKAHGPNDRAPHLSFWLREWQNQPARCIAYLT